MLDLLVVAGTVITVDEQRRVLRPGAVGMKGGRITGEILSEARQEHSAAVARTGLEALLDEREGTWGAIRYPEGSGIG